MKNANVENKSSLRRARSVLDCGGKVRWTAIFVETRMKMDANSVGATSSSQPTAYDATTGLKLIWTLVLQRCRTFGAVLCLFILHSSFSLRGQSYSIDWYKVSGGGGTSTNGNYSVTGTIGQPDASGPMSGGNYSVTGGFWSLISVVQTVGAPTLFISHASNSVTVYWQNTGTWTLQQNGNLADLNGWGTSGGIATANGTNSITINHPTGNLFFRLKQ